MAVAAIMASSQRMSKRWCIKRAQMAKRVGIHGQHVARDGYLVGPAFNLDGALCTQVSSMPTCILPRLTAEMRRSPLGTDWSQTSTAPRAVWDGAIQR
jgi:hypothetical protein